jgi:hypothetical protein
MGIRVYLRVPIRPPIMKLSSIEIAATLRVTQNPSSKNLKCSGVYTSMNGARKSICAPP